MRPKSSPPPGQGFTLIELLIVIVMIAIISAIAMPRVNISHYRADAAMRKAQSILQQAHHSAIQRQSNVIVSFDTAQSRIRVALDTNNNNKIDDWEDVRWKQLDDHIQFLAPPIAVSGFTVSSVNGDNIGSLDQMPTVVYRRNGAVSSNFTLYLGTRKDKDTDFRGLSVSRATGRVELYRLGREQTWYSANY